MNSPSALEADSDWREAEASAAEHADQSLIGRSTSHKSPSDNQIDATCTRDTQTKGDLYRAEESAKLTDG